MSGPLYVLNFYSPVFVDQLKRGRKTATIRLGDKSRKYKRGQVVWVTVGYRHQPREKIFSAVIDDVEVKQVSELSPRDIEHDNPEFRRLEDTVEFLGKIYGRPISDEDTVTVIRFSQIVERPSTQFGNGETSLAELGRAGRGHGRLPLPDDLAARIAESAGLGRDLRLRLLAGLVARGRGGRAPRGGRRERRRPVRPLRMEARSCPTGWSSSSARRGSRPPTCSRATPRASSRARGAGACSSRAASPRSSTSGTCGRPSAG